MDQFEIHNLHWKGLRRFEEGDPHLTFVKELKYIAPLDWWKQIPRTEGGIYLLTGGRQIGKSTSLKLFMQFLMNTSKFKESPQRLFYFPCDQIMNRQHLYEIIQSFLGQVGNHFFCLLIDEITFIQDWEKTIKGIADEGHFRHGICIITGSDRVLLEEAATALPGRRGKINKVDFSLHPLSFRQFIELVAKGALPVSQKNLSQLQSHFEKYQICGGFPKAINDLYMKGAISESTIQTYRHWIVGDFIKRGKKQETLLEVLLEIFNTLGSQVTFSELSRRCASLSKETFIDYVSLLQRMEIICVQEAFDQNKLRAFPKKAKKICFWDPFILRTVHTMLVGSQNIDSSKIVEGIVASHFARRYPTYYLKAEGEVDVVAVEHGRPFFIEVKWGNQIRPKDLKQIKKYKNALVLTKNLEEGKIDDVPTCPLVKKILEI